MYKQIYNIYTKTTGDALTETHRSAHQYLSLSCMAPEKDRQSASWRSLISLLTLSFHSPSLRLSRADLTFSLMELNFPFILDLALANAGICEQWACMF